MPEPAGRRQPVLERAQVVLVDVAGLLVAGRLRGRLGLEALPLVDGVVELAVGVGQLAPADDDLEALDERGSSRCGRASGEISRGWSSTNVGSISVCSAVVVVDLGHQPPGAPAVLVGDAEPVADRARVLDRHRRVHALAGALRDQVGHRHPPPRRREVDGPALELDQRRAVGGDRGAARRASRRAPSCRW